jgi:hypothetical protein
MKKYNRGPKMRDQVIEAIEERSKVEIPRPEPVKEQEVKVEEEDTTIRYAEDQQQVNVSVL